MRRPCRRRPRRSRQASIMSAVGCMFTCPAGFCGRSSVARPGRRRGSGFRTRRARSAGRRGASRGRTGAASRRDMRTPANDERGAGARERGREALVGGQEALRNSLESHFRGCRRCLHEAGLVPWARRSLRRPLMRLTAAVGQMASTRARRRPSGERRSRPRPGSRAEPASRTRTLHATRRALTPAGPP